MVNHVPSGVREYGRSVKDDGAGLCVTARVCRHHQCRLGTTAKRRFWRSRAGVGPKHLHFALAGRKQPECRLQRPLALKNISVSSCLLPLCPASPSSSLFLPLFQTQSNGRTKSFQKATLGHAILIRFSLIAFCF